MAVRIALLAMLIALSGAYGLMGARRLDLRVEELRELRLAMKLLREQIHYLHTPLPEALWLCAERYRPPVDALFRTSAEVLRDPAGAGIAEAWEAGVRRLGAAGHLHPQDIGVLRQASGRLGSSGLAEQTRLLDWLDGELKRQQETAEAHRASQRQLWSYGGFIVGAILALLIW